MMVVIFKGFAEKEVKFVFFGKERPMISATFN